MLTKELFFHQQTPNGRSLGFSAIFMPAKQGDMVSERNELQVWAAITFCNKKDKAFSKKIARTVLRERPMELVRVKDIPKLLSNARDKAVGNGCYCGNGYNSLLRHFV